MYIVSNDEQQKCFDTDELRQRMPKIGSIVKRIPTFDNYGSDVIHVSNEPKTGIVVYVNNETLTYCVEFNNGNYKFRECFKVPDARQDKFN